MWSLYHLKWYIVYFGRCQSREQTYVQKIAAISSISEDCYLELKYPKLSQIVLCIWKSKHHVAYSEKVQNDSIIIIEENDCMIG